MKVTLPIIDRSRKYGYINWKKQMDKKLLIFFGHRKEVEVCFNGSLIGSRKIDWKFRRISIGYTKTRNLPINSKEFLLKFDEKGTLRILCQ